MRCDMNPQGVHIHRLVNHITHMLSCRETANELWKWMRQLEAEKFEMQYRYTCQKYEVRYYADEV